MDDLPNDQPVDDAALFASVTGNEPPPAAPAAPSPAPTPSAPAIPDPATPAVPEPAAVPSSRLREEAERARAAERERDDLKARLERLERAQPPAPAKEAPKPKDIWEDPNAFVSEALTPVQEQLRSAVLTFSRRDAVREHGEEKVDAAEQALKQAISSGAVNSQEVTARLRTSLDPVGDVVAWHTRTSAMQRVGNDPDKWLKSEVDKLKADPTFQAEMLALAQGTATGAAPLVERPQTVSPPSLRNIGTSPAPASAANAPSDAELFASTVSRRKRA